MITPFYIIISILSFAALIFIHLEKYDKDGVDKILIGLITFLMIISLYFVLSDPDNGELYWPYHRHEGFLTTAFTLCLFYLARKKENQEQSSKQIDKNIKNREGLKNNA